MSELQISLCAIVKNDALVIRRMLDSVVGVVDEIVIADTGSTDGTADIIGKFAAEHPGLVRLHQFQWVDDFSAARNFTLSQAVGDWILVLDADEFLDPDEKTMIRKYVVNTNFDGVFLKIRNYTGRLNDLNSVLDMDAVRLFRRGHLYEGTIHEQIAGPITQTGGTLGNCPVHVHHIGYTHEFVNMKGKNKRNVGLLQTQLSSISKRDKELRWFATVNLMAEYSATGDWALMTDMARPVIEEMKAEKQPPNFLVRIYKLYITALHSLHRFDDALRVCKEALRMYPRHTDLQLMVGDTYMTQGAFRQAIESFERCREWGDVKFSLVEYREGSGSYLAARQIAYSWFRLGDDMSAREWFVRAYKENTEQPGVIPMIVMLTPEQDILAEMEKSIRTPQRYAEFLEHYAMLGFDDTLDYVKKSESKWGTSDSTKRARFAHAVRHGETPLDIHGDRDAVSEARIGLWYYEQGDEEQAFHHWLQSGEVGDYLIHIATTASEKRGWEIKGFLKDFIACNAVKFLTKFGPYIADLSETMPFILRTGLLEAFTTDAYLQRREGTCEEWEWKAQVYLAQGKVDRAKHALNQAVCSDGYLTVRGYCIQADIDPVRQREIYREARKIYPTSKLLSFIWLNCFVPNSVPQGVVM